MKKMMIDYRVSVDEGTKFVRRVIDDYEFCVRDGMAYFISEGIPCEVTLENISQIYTY